MSKEIPFLDLKQDIGIISKHATIETRFRVEGGWFICENLVVRSTADRIKLEASGWRRRSSTDNWFFDYTASSNNEAKKVFNSYKEVYNTFIEKAKDKLHQIQVVDGSERTAAVEETTPEPVAMEEEPVPASPVLEEQEVEALPATADNKEEETNMRTIEIPVGGIGKFLAVAAVLAVLAFGGFGLFTGKLSSDRQVVDVVEGDSMTIMTVEQENGEWLVLLGSPEKEEQMYFRKDGDYSSTWYDGTGAKTDGDDLERLYEADKVRKQADAVLMGSTVKAD